MTDERQGVTRSWAPTWALHRGVVVGLAGVVLGVLLRRVDVALLALPLLGVATWSLARRPTQDARFRLSCDVRSLREGRAATLTADLAAPGATDVALALPLRADARYSPRRGVAVDAVRGGVGSVQLRVEPIRYGDRSLGPATLTAMSSWGAFRAVLDGHEAGRLVTLPRSETFTSGRGLPRPAGLVGRGSSPRPGRGNDLAGVRPFAAGDRLRRIHWPATTRTGRLHVAATFGEEDSRLLLLVDALDEVGDHDEQYGSSLDQAVRGAAAVGEHFLRKGDRVGVRAVGPGGIAEVPARSGRRQAVRIDSVLARVGRRGTPDGTETRPPGPRSRWPAAPADAVIVAFTPLLSEGITAHLAELARSHTLIVVDTLPASLRDGGAALRPGGWAALDEVGRRDPLTAQAWRIRLLERRAVLDGLTRRAGAPVVPWQGAGTLDAVLAQVQRRRRAPRAVRR